ncbi:MAG: hypothetical protein U1E27_14460 [Kiritimatiellia bacterium]|nr:hypothetical protein [Kiritimatiellia bacterium]
MTPRCRVKVVGVGSAGCNILGILTDEWTECPDALAVDTHAERLKVVGGAQTTLLGETVTGGMSTGGDPVLGRRAAESSISALRNEFCDVDLVLMVTGLGGGTGGGAGPAVARAAREAGALTLAFCTLPFFFAGSMRRRAAEEGLLDMRQSADAVIVFPNQRLLEWIGTDCGIEISFHKVGEVVASSLRALWKLLSEKGALDLDFADLKQMVTASGGTLALAQADAIGEDRAQRVLQGLNDSPMLEHGSVLSSARAILAGILGGPDLTLVDLQTIISGITGLARPDADVHLGVMVDPESIGRVHITLLTAEQVERPELTKADGPLEDSSAVPETTRIRTPRKTPAKAGTKQVELPLDGLDGEKAGRFRKEDPTIIDGQNLDEPTFIRRGIRLSSAVN